MTLVEYLTQTGRSQTSLAKAVGVQQPTISKLARHVIRPSLELAVDIERETGGAVPVRTWVDGSASAMPPSSGGSDDAL